MHTSVMSGKNDACQIFSERNLVQKLLTKVVPAWNDRPEHMWCLIRIYTISGPDPEHSNTGGGGGHRMSKA